MSPEELNEAPPPRSYKLVSVKVREPADDEEGGVRRPELDWVHLPWFGSSEPTGEKTETSDIIRVFILTADWLLVL